MEGKALELFRKAVTGSYDELRIYGDWYASMEVFGLDYESAGDLTNREKENLIGKHSEEYKSLWQDTLFPEWKREHNLA